MGPRDRRLTDRVRFESDARGGVTVVVDGHPQSYVALEDPGLLAFDYVAHLALVLAGMPSGRLRVTHVGGAGMTLARWLAVNRPGSAQLVLEPDAELTALVRSRLPLPRGHRIRVRPQDGVTGVSRLADGSADALVLDAYAAGQVPASLADPAFLADVRRVLGEAGVFVANLADEPGLRWVARFLATLQGVGGFPEIALLAAPEVFKGRRFGNVVVAAGRADLELDALRRGVASAPVPTGIRIGAEVTRLVAGARPFTEEDVTPSPQPPDPGSWRVR